MKHYINTIDNTIWAFEEDVNPFDLPSTPATLQLIEEPRPSSDHIFENGTWVLQEVIIPTPVELTPQEKLANAGLTVDELKSLLGL